MWSNEGNEDLYNTFSNPIILTESLGKRKSQKFYQAKLFAILSNCLRAYGVSLYLKKPVRK